jgi:hypothetical protein
MSMHTPVLIVMYGLDLLILLLALGGALVANGERNRHLVPRDRLLLPGVLAFAGTLILLSYPEIRDLGDPQAWLVVLAGITVGAARGWAMKLHPDRAFRVVRLERAGDGLAVGSLTALFAAVQGGIETGLRDENPYEATAELLMLIASGYLLGRSLVLWLRARTGGHVDLKEE